MAVLSPRRKRRGQDALRLEQRLALGREQVIGEGDAACHILRCIEDRNSGVLETQRRPGPKEIPSGIPTHEWPTVLQRVLEHHESYYKVAND